MAQMVFMTVEQFKEAKGITGKIDFAKGSKDDGTPTKFVIAGGSTYKAQLAIDYAKPIRFMYSIEEGFDNGCFTNVKPIEVEYSL
jgi:hypothetical protein